MADLSATLSKLGLTPGEIAARSRLSERRIQQLIDGKSATATELRALMRGLRLPARAFSSAGFVTEASSPVVRFRNTRSKAEYDPTNERVAGFVGAALRVLPQRESPPSWLQYFWRLPHSAAEEAAMLAQKFRDLLYGPEGDDPAIELPQLLDRFEGVVLGQLPDSRFEGASVVVGGYAFIFIAPRFPGRMLFTLAHELGHVLGGHSTNAPHYDLPGDVGRLKNIDEAFADNFAVSFLLPPRAVGNVLSGIRKSLDLHADAIGDIEVIILSRFFGVSFEVAARRCEQLRLLPYGGASSLIEFVKERFGGSEQRAREAQLPDRQSISIEPLSDFLISAASREIESGNVSSTWIADRLGVSISQLQKAHSNLAGRSSSAH